MSHTHKFENRKEVILPFILGGKAFFTVVSNTSDGVKRFTYKIKAKKDKGNGDKITVWWVSILTSPDNVEGYTFFASLFPNGDDFDYRHGKKTKIGQEAESVKVFKWLLLRLKQDLIPNHVEVWHMGRCGKCGRPLTVPESIERGIGPDCASRM